jgi:AcrR family transcriptional regulator
MKSKRPADLREACVSEALAIIGERGVESLSIREVARRLGVSHQAPYRHFASSDHLLAEIVRRTYAMFSAHLRKRPKGESAADDMRHMGEAYLAFALKHPLHYRLIFGTPLPDPTEHPEMMQEARFAFSILLDGIARLHGRPGDASAETKLDALFVWATVHGLATILQTEALDKLGLRQRELAQAIPHTLACIGRALAGPGQ